MFQNVSAVPAWVLVLAAAAALVGMGAVLSRKGKRAVPRGEALDVLFREYPGNAAWERFAALFPADATPLNSVIKDPGIAAVLHADMGDRAQAWLQQKIPALDGHSASEVLSKHPAGQRIIRSLVMRFPR